MWLFVIFQFALVSSSPSFEVLEVWLESLTMHISVGQKLPTDLVFDIEHYKGTQSRSSSINSTPDGLHASRPKTPTDECNPTARPEHSSPEPLQMHPSTIVNTDAAAAGPNNSTPASPTPCTLPTTPDDDALPLDAKLASFIRDIPKSPHLSKDFSPTGERIRDSVRARRRQRMQQQREQHRKSDAPDEMASAATPQPPNGSAAADPADRPIEQVLRAVSDTLELRRTQLNQLPEPERPAAKVRPYGMKGFIINMGNEGALTLNNVRDLEGCSDFDSSCDTSLNYMDVNGVGGGMPPICLAVESALESPRPDRCYEQSASLSWPTAAAAVRVIDETSARPTPSRFGSPLSSSSPRNGQRPTSPQSLPPYRQLSDGDVEPQLPATTSPLGAKRPLAGAHRTADNGTTKTYKSALDELKSKFNMCRTKLETLESNSRRSMKNYFRSQPAAVHAPLPGGRAHRAPKAPKSPDQLDGAATTPVRHFMYSRINPLLSPDAERRVFSELSPRSSSPAPQSPPATASHQRFGTRLFRIGETPIFERRNVRSMFGGSLFRRSDSDENLPAKCSYKVRTEADAAPVHAAMRPTSATGPAKQKVSPTADLRPALSFASPARPPEPTTIGPHRSPTKKTLIVTSKPNTPLVFTTQRHQQAPTNSTTSTRSGQLRSQVRSADRHHSSQQSQPVRSGGATAACRVSLLSPERIYRLNAKLTENKQAIAAATAANNSNNNNNGQCSRSPASSAAGPARTLSPNGKDTVAIAVAAANNNNNHTRPQARSSAHLRPTGRCTATQVHASPAAARRQEAAAANQYQKSMLVHKFADSPVRRTVGKFDATAPTATATVSLPVISKVGTSGNCR